MATFIYQFIAMSQPQKAEALRLEGQFLSRAEMDETVYLLYSLGDFYVEVTGVGEDVMDIAPFREGERFNKYLHDIDISSLNIPS